MEFTKEQIAQAHACKTPEELLALAKANNVDLSEESAQAFCEIFTEEERAEGELADAELENVAGGSGCPERKAYQVQYFNSREEVQFLFNIGDEARAFRTSFGSITETVKIADRQIKCLETGTYIDIYRLVIDGRANRSYQDRSWFEVRN